MISLTQINPSRHLSIPIVQTIVVEVPIEELMRESSVLPESFYSRPAVDVARDCLGTILVHGDTAGRIVEVEAYLGVDDLAAHSSRGITPRTRVIFGRPGHAYVYFIYGMYECLNFVAEPEGSAGCVLIRALEPVSGLDAMRKRRPTAKKVQDLASGPGRLTRAMAISRELNGASLIDGPLQVRRLFQDRAIDIVCSPRIGITKCAELPLRFFIRGNPYVSRSKVSRNLS